MFRKTIERERIPIGWSALTRVYRRMELRGELRVESAPGKGTRLTVELPACVRDLAATAG